MSTTSTSSILYFVGFAALAILVLKEVNSIVVEPYMDEPFHVPQALAYCAGNWTTWDPKITTPPGLYILSVLLHKMFLLKCNLFLLRFTSTLTLVSFPILCTRLLRLHQRLPPPRTLLAPTLDAIVVSMFPILWFFGFLYYTELPSTALTAATFIAARRNKHTAAAILGFLACTMRQNNIIWVLYAFAYSQVANLRFSTFSPLKDPMFLSAGLVDISRLAFSLPAAIPYVLQSFAPYAGLITAFVAFVIYNGGIVLGDKSNHIPTLHVPQLYYFYAFATLLGWPVLVSSPGGPRMLAGQVYVRMFGTYRAAVVTSLSVAIIGMTIAKFTIHHPFLLSDNRHFTFYVWHRVFMVHHLVPLLFAPGYLICFFAWLVRVGDDQSLLQVLLLPFTLLPLLLPTPLLEPRYFLIPYIFLRVQVTKTSAWAIALEGLWYGFINWATMSVFLYAERPGVGRFMW